MPGTALPDELNHVATAQEQPKDVIVNNKTRTDNLDAVVARAHREKLQREQGYRERALKMYPWICGRCEREFDRTNLSELTVHHRDHDHDNNAEDGSNWELLCLYCHDNEHQRQLEAAQQHGAGTSGPDNDSPRPENKLFAGLESLLKKGGDAD